MNNTIISPILEMWKLGTKLVKATCPKSTMLSRRGRTGTEVYLSEALNTLMH